MTEPFMESINAEAHLGMRPFCPCCGGGEYRKGYSCTKAKSRKLNRRARKARHKDKNRDSIRYYKE